MTTVTIERLIHQNQLEYKPGIPILATKMLLNTQQCNSACKQALESRRILWRSRCFSVCWFRPREQGCAFNLFMSSVPITNAYKHMEHGVKLTSCYAARLFLLAAVMYVDNTDLLHWGPSLNIQDKPHQT